MLHTLFPPWNRHFGDSVEGERLFCLDLYTVQGVCSFKRGTNPESRLGVFVFSST